jgi:hypothetical protein
LHGFDGLRRIIISRQYPNVRSAILIETAMNDDGAIRTLQVDSKRSALAVKRKVHLQRRKSAWTEHGQAL